MREKRRDRLKALAKKFKNLHGTGLGVGTGSGSGVGSSVGMEPHRSISVPASPRRSADATLLDDSAPVEPRQKSFDLGVVDQDQDPDQGASANIEADTSGITETYVSVSVEDAAPTDVETESDHKMSVPTDHVEILEPLKVEKKKLKDESDGWAKFGRRVSMTVGLSKNKDGRRRSRSVEKGRGRQGGVDKSSDPALSLLVSATSPDVESTSALPPTLPRLEPNGFKSDSQSTSPTPTPTHIPVISPPLSFSTRLNLMSLCPVGPAVLPLEPKSQLPSATPEEAAYLHHILADITPASASASLFSGIFKQQSSGSGSGGNSNMAANLLMRMNPLPGVEECM